MEQYPQKGAFFMKKKAKILLICYTAALILGLSGYAYAVSGAAGSYRT